MILGKSELFFPNYLEVAEVTGSLNNRGKIKMRVGKIVLNLGLAS